MKLLLYAIISVVFAAPLLSQSDMEYALSRHKGNKIVLLGDLKADDSAKWTKLLDSEEIYGYGFKMLDRKNIEETIDRLTKISVDALENWLIQRYGLSLAARWAVLDNENQLVISGIKTPSPKELEKQLDSKGLKTPLRKLRDFLKENPGHLDAMADLLNEARRRALHLMRQIPQEAVGDLDDATDLMTWGVMASETDKVFKGSWLGADLSYFRIGEPQPEGRSKLMRTIFRRHIPKVESAIMLHPTNDALWNIWAWMANGMADYKWEKFVDGFEPTIFYSEFNFIETMPSAEVSAWLIQQAHTRKDWGMVIKFARVARKPIIRKESSKAEWQPSGGFTRIRNQSPPNGHPIKTVYALHIEALLKSGDIDGANNIYDEMLRIEGNKD
ncbi:MAG: hypothetical protein LBH03_04545, partial [Holophagales bacterium]|nr:hypothetical protein [Holophagales bacterium]